MRRHDRRAVRPEFECMERREVLSGVIATMIAQKALEVAAGPHSQPAQLTAPLPLPGGGSATITVSAGGGTGGAGGASGNGGGGGGGASSGGAASFFTPGGAAGQNVITPPGQPTPVQLKRSFFQASYQGPYFLAHGRTDAEATQFYMKGKGTSNKFHHGTIQLRLFVPKDPTTAAQGLSTQFDRNINDAGLLGLDVNSFLNPNPTNPPGGNAANNNNNPADVDRFGRPLHLNFTVDINISSGGFGEASGQGTMDFRYGPPRHIKGQGVGTEGIGTASVRIRGFLLTFHENNPMAISDIGI